MVLMDESFLRLSRWTEFKYWGIDVDSFPNTVENNLSVAVIFGSMHDLSEFIRI